MADRDLPSFDLVVATVDRVEELRRFLASLERQTYRAFRVVLVDQNDDDRLLEAVAMHDRLEILHCPSPRGLSRARNLGLLEALADVVAFPDDDCEYPPDLLERVAKAFAREPTLAGITGRSTDRAGWSSPSWKRDARELTVENVWNRAISYTIFLRRTLVERVGGFDEELGLGSGTPWSSGEEIELLVRALRTGARIEYDPEFVVFHEVRARTDSELRALGYRDGASVGYILRRHRYGPRMLAGMATRPIGGVLAAVIRRDFARARFHAATLRGRLRGFASAA